MALAAALVVAGLGLVAVDAHATTGTGDANYVPSSRLDNDTACLFDSNGPSNSDQLHTFCVQGASGAAIQVVGIKNAVISKGKKRRINSRTSSTVGFTTVP